MELLTVNEAAEATRMSASWWRQKIFRKEVSYLKIGRAVRIPRATVDQILKESLQESRARIAR
ncbi:MAG: helix-turn-helix domain-containing protein [Deltaproteobacteria bacterium]|nr:helix-turn-helix domain-containing protein [Deltaproteobacteria bacterium]